MQPSSEQYQEAIAILKRGGIVAYPTETCYGLAVDPDNDQAIRKLYDLKGRDYNKPLSLIVSDTECLPLYVQTVPPSYIALMNSFWPGPLSLIFSANPESSILLRGNGDTLAIRISSHPVAHEFSRIWGRGLTATSANISGHEGCTSGECIQTELTGHVDYLLDAGTVRGGLGSTMVEEIAGHLVIIRDGVIAAAEIHSLSANKEVLLKKS